MGILQGIALGVLGRAAALADGEGHLVGELLVAGVEVDVVGDEELAGFGKVIGGIEDEAKVLDSLLTSVLGADVDERELNA